MKNFRLKLEKASFMDEIFGAEFEVYFSPILLSVQHYQNEHNVELEGITNATAALYFKCPKREKHIIFFQNRPADEEIMHEALHASIKVMEDRGVRVESGNDETVCYYQGWIYRNVKTALKMIRKKSKKNAK